MALSGTLNTSGYYDASSPYYLQFTWSATQSIPNNQSTISWTVKVRGGYSGYHNTLFQRYVKVAGDAAQSGESYWTVYDGTVVYSGTTVVDHNANGTGSFTVTVKGSFETWDSSYNTAGSTTFTLDTIPRAAEITSAPNFTDQDSPALKYSNPAGSVATLSAAISLDGSTADIPYRSASATGGSYTFSLTTAEKNTLLNATSSSKTRTVYYLLKTVIGGNTFTDSQAATFTVADVVANRPTVTIADTIDNSAIPSTYRANFASMYIQNISKTSVTLTGTAMNGASVSSYKSTIGAKSYNGSSFTSDTLTSSGTVAINATVTDSRGYTGVASKNLTVNAYANPSVTGLSVFRCDSTGVAQDDGTNIKINATRVFTSLSDVNKCILRYRWKAVGGSFNSWTTLIARTTSNNTYSSVISGTFAKDTAYVIEVGVIDDIGKTASIETNIPTETITLHLKEGGKAVGLGTYATTDNTVETGWSIVSTNTTPLQFKGASATYPLVQAKDVNVSYGAACAFGNAGGTTIVGAGESAGAALSGVGSDVEDLYLTADGSIYLCPNSQTWANRKTITLGTDGSITTPATITASGGYLKSTLNGNTVQIGSQNTSYCHITNSADKPFWFNKTIEVAGNVLPYNNNANTCGSSSKKWSGVYATQFYGSVAKLLWTNSANSYSTGTVSLSLSGYTHIIIGGWAWESEGYFQNVVKVGTYSIIGYTGVNTSTASNATTFLNCAYRQATVSTSGVTFTNGFMIYNGSAYTGWATRAVPKWIWGVNYGT